MAVAFTGFIIALKFNYCHGVSTEPGFRNCSDAINLFKNSSLVPGRVCHVGIRDLINCSGICLFDLCELIQSVF